MMNVTRRFDGDSGAAPAIRDASLQINAGNVVVILGPSGCGKSTLLRCLAGVEPYEGTITIGGRDRNKVSARDLPCEWLPQFAGDTFLPNLTLNQNLGLSARLRGVHGPSDADRRTQAQRFGIEKLLGRRPREVSGGELQRAALCRAFLGNPGLMLLDEPLTGIDEQHRAGIRSLILSMQAGHPSTMVCVTHDVQDALWLADHCVIMNRGSIEQTGSPREIADDPASAFVLRFFGAPELNTLPTAVLSTVFGDRLPAAVDQALIRAEDTRAVSRGHKPADSTTVQVVEGQRREQRWMGDHFRVTIDVAGLSGPLVAHSPTEVDSRVEVFARPSRIFLFDTKGRRAPTEP